MDEPVTKRLHVSGLTPSITLADLSTRLGMYGSITSLDKFGEMDALGQPRKFAYVTLETTKGKLGKCASFSSSCPMLVELMNVLTTDDVCEWIM